MSSDFSFSSKQIRTDIDSTANQIRSGSKQIKKETSKALDKASKKLDEKITELNKSISLSPPYASNIFEINIKNIQAKKEELKQIRLSLSKANNDSEKIMNLANEAIKQIEEINQQRIGISIEVKPLKHKISNLNITVSNKVRTLFSSFNQELKIQKQLKENAVAAELLDNAVHHLGRTILISVEPDKTTLTQAALNLEEVANHSLVLDAQKPLNESRKKLLKERSSIDQGPLSANAKNILISLVDEQISKIDILNLSLIGRSISKPQVSDFKSEALKLNKNTNQFLSKLSKLQNSPELKIVSDTHKTLKESIERLKSIKTEELDAPPPIKKATKAKIEEHIKILKTQLKKVTELEARLGKPPPLSMKEAIHFQTNATKLANTANNYLDGLSLDLLQAKWVTHFYDRENMIEEFAKRKDIPAPAYNETMEIIRMGNEEIEKFHLDESPLSKMGSEKDQSLEQQSLDLQHLESISKTQKEAIDKAVYDATITAALRAEVDALAASVAAQASIANSLEETLALKYLVTEKGKDFADFYDNDMPEELSQGLYLLNRQIETLKQSIPKDSSTDTAEAFADKVLQTKYEVTEQLAFLLDNFLSSKAEPLQAEIPSEEFALIKQQADSFQEATFGILKNYATVFSVENEPNFIIKERDVRENLGSKGLTTLKTMIADYKKLINAIDENSSREECQTSITEMQRLSERAAAFQEKYRAAENS